MESENARLIREGYAALNRLDVEWLSARMDPDLEFASRFSGLSGRTYKGLGAFEQWFADVTESWESIEQTPERLVDLDAERTAVEVRFKARGRGSGVEVDQRIAFVFTVRDGKVARIDPYDSLEDALADAD
jgi:ketosteroid isomerase-like protein